MITGTKFSFYTEHDGQRYRCDVTIDTAAIARTLGYKAVINRTKRSTIRGIATVKAHKVAHRGIDERTD